ncbi:MAG: ATP-binding protein [Bryobacterales bacterium]|nr:ATP-binding protein [Bryobacterales bacterium]
MPLVDLLRRPEGKTLEFKRDLSSPDGILKTLVAFANTAGGTIVIGVDNGSKNVRGVPDVLEAEERLASLVSDDPPSPRSGHRGGAVAELERDCCSGLSQQHSSSLLAAARISGRRLPPCGLDQSQGRGAADRGVEALEPDGLV